MIENSHASTVLGWADGLAKANEVLRPDDHVVAVIGDGALTGGMAWEALNNIAAAKDRPLVIVVNDNEWSYSPTIGGLANHLATLRTTDGYEQFLARAKELLERTPVIGRPLYETLHGAKKGLKDFIAPQGMFEDLGLKYVGPIDGHDIEARGVRAAARQALRRPGHRALPHREGPRLHPAERDEADRFHGIGPIHPDTGLPIAAGGAGLDLRLRRGDGQARPGARGHRRHHRRHAAAGRPDRSSPRPSPTGSTTSASPSSTRPSPPRAWPPAACTRSFAVYATFLNRAFDQVLMDVALHRCGVTFVLDRAGVTGTDGASHNGMWDMSILQVVPGLRIAAPRDADQVRAQLREAVEVDDAPTVVRYSKGAVGPAVAAVGRIGGMDVLRAPAERRARPTSCWSRSARSPRCAWRSPTCSTRRASPPPWSTRAGSSRSTRRCPASPRGTASSSPSRTTAGPAASVRPSPRRCGTPTWTCRCATSASRSSSSTHASRKEVMAAIGLTAPDIARQVTGLVAKHRRPVRRRRAGGAKGAAEPAEAPATDSQTAPWAGRSSVRMVRPAHRRSVAAPHRVNPPSSPPKLLYRDLRRPAQFGELRGSASVEVRR